MSVGLARNAQDAPSSAYVVAAPCRADVMTATLREAYADAGDDLAPFADVMALLDRIDIVPRAM